MQKVDTLPNYVPYLGRMVPKEHFAAFIYKKDGTSKLTRNYDEFTLAIDSGEWFAEKPEPKLRTKKSSSEAIDHGSDS